MEGEPRERKPVTGKYPVDKDRPLGPEQHHIGWGNALERALKDINWPPDEYQVQVEFGAKIDVTNPGSVIEYHVTLI
jgi:hypothetical protein